MSRCTWTPSKSPNATASSSSPQTCCLRERSIWRLQFANHRCAIAGGWCTLPSVQIRLVSLASGKTPPSSGCSRTLTFSTQIAKRSRTFRRRLCPRIRRMPSAWYPNYEQKLGDNKVTRVGSVFNNLIGSDGEKVLRLKADETKHFLPFVMDVCRRPQRSASRARGRIGFAVCWRRAAVVHGCAEARATAIVEGLVDCCVTHNSQASLAGIKNETKTSLVLGGDDAMWEKKGIPDTIRLTLTRASTNRSLRLLHHATA